MICDCFFHCMPSNSVGSRTPHRRWQPGFARSLGYTLASLFLPGAPALADDVLPPKIEAVSPTGINLSTGGFNYQNSDLAIGDLSLVRRNIDVVSSKNGTAPNLPFFGLLQTHNFDIYVAKITQAPNGPFPQRYRLVAHLGNSSAGSWIQDSSGFILEDTLDATNGTMALSGGAYVYTSQDGTIYTFNPSVTAGGSSGTGSQRIDNIVYPDGRKIIFSYVSGKLKEVSDNRGHAIIFDYGANGYVSTACGFNLSQNYVTPSSTCTSAAIKTSYSYTSNNITSFTDILGNVTTYTFSSKNEITCIKPPGFATCKVTNTYPASGTVAALHQVTQQTLADGTVWNIASFNNAATNNPDAYADADGQQGSAVTDPQSHVASFSFTKSSPYTFQDANGAQTQYRYTGGNSIEATAYDSPPPVVAEGEQLIEAVFPEGNKYLGEYNGPYNAISKQTMQAKPGSGLPDRVLQYSYPTTTVSRQTQTKPLTKTDPNGNVTTWAYATWGGMLSEMKPAPTSGAARPLKLFSYVQKSAYIKNSGGTLVSTGLPVWLTSTVTECQTVAGSSTPTCDTAAPQTVSTYQYGADGTADNLLVRGFAVTSAGITERTCYGYDVYSRKISETKANANLASCP